MTEDTTSTQHEEQSQDAATQQPEQYYCGLHGFVDISHFPCSGKE